MPLGGHHTDCDALSQGAAQRCEGRGNAGDQGAPSLGVGATIRGAGADDLDRTPSRVQRTQMFAEVRQANASFDPLGDVFGRDPVCMTGAGLKGAEEAKCPAIERCAIRGSLR